jgi:oligopeptide/dipeptide ABC transporter ATP-binding protein
MLVEIEDLSITFQTRRGPIKAVRGLSLSLEEGQTLGIVGESGCGKSITNLALMGLLPPNAKIKARKFNFMGKNLLTLNENEWQAIRGKDIAMIFQDPMTALNPCYTVGAQIAESLKAHAPTLDKKTCKEKVLALLEQVGIPAPKSRLSNYPHELSGGMAQRVMIAMALAGEPKLLIADEPTTALDVTIQAQILELLKDLQKERQMAMILVTHDLGVVANNAQTIQVMYAGEVVERASANEIIKNPKHHYTQGLIASHPGHRGLEFRSKLPSIKGVVPDLLVRPKGCQFHPRCAGASEQCEARLPHLILDETGRSVACHHPLETRGHKA